MSPQVHHIGLKRQAELQIMKKSLITTIIIFFKKKKEREREKREDQDINVLTDLEAMTGVRDIEKRRKERR